MIRWFKNIFNVQTKITDEIIKALDITVLEPEREELYRHPTNNLDAYNLFNQARDIMYKNWHINYAKLDSAVKLFEQALEIDNNLVMAYVWISEIHSWQYHVKFDFTEERQAKSKRAIDKALEMQPNLPEAKLYEAWYYYRVFRDYDRARELLKMVMKRRPNEPPRLLASIERRQGDWENSVQHWEEAFDLDPRRPRIALEIASTYMSMRNYEKAEFWYHRNNILVPGDNISKGRLAKCYMFDNGNIKTTLSTLKTINNMDSQNRSALESILLIGLYTKNYDLILNHLDSINTVFINDQTDFMDKYSAYAYIYYVIGDTHKVNQYADSSLMVLTDLLETKQDDPRYHSAAGLAYAFKGQKNAALSAANRAIDIFPISLDSLDGPLYVYNLAWVCSLIGEEDRAISNLEYLLSIEAGLFVSKSVLKIDPKWNNLKNYPRFQKLIE